MTFRMPRATALLGTALVAALLGAPAAAVADDADVTWGVQPSSPTGPDGRDAFDYQVAPGTVVSDWVTVTNRSTRSAEFRIYAADATTDYDSGSFTLISSDELSLDVGAWTAIDGAPASCPEGGDDLPACLASVGITLVLGPGERADIPFTLTVPPDAAPGDHAGGIVAVHTSRADPEGGATVLRESRVGSRIYLRVDGPVSPGLVVTGVVSGYDGGWNPLAGGTGRIGFDLVNAGNVRLSAQPRVSLTGPVGIPLGEFALPAVQNLMPGDSAHVAAELEGVPPLLLVTGAIGVEPVTADGIAASTDTVPARATVSTTTWAVPWGWLAIVVVLGGGAALVVWIRRSSRQSLAWELAAFREQVIAEDRASRGGGEPHDEVTPTDPMIETDPMPSRGTR